MDTGMGRRTTGQEVPGLTVNHWCTPDIPRDILAAAWTPGLPAPSAIHIRPELHARMVSAVPSPRTEDDLVGPTLDIPLVVDDRIPASPGYEIHRCG